MEAGPGDRVLDVATGTGAVAREVIARTGCTVVGLDQSPEMLAEARRRLPGVELIQGTADELPFPDASFDALTFTYLLRYVPDPAATHARAGAGGEAGRHGLLARVRRPPRRVAAALGALRAGRPARSPGRVISPGWHEVGSFLGPSIRDFYAEYPLGRVLDLWRAAGIGDVHARRMSLGGGVVIWGRRT